MKYGLVIGFVPNKPNFVIVTNGLFQIHARVTGKRSEVQIGGKYSLYKQNSIYYVGAKT